MPLFLVILLGGYLLFAIFQNVRFSKTVDKLQERERIMKEIIMEQNANTRKMHKFVMRVLEKDSLEEEKKEYLELVKGLHGE